MNDTPKTFKSRQAFDIASDTLNAYFGKTPLFKNIDKDVIATLPKKCRLFHFQKGNVIFRLDEPCNWLYFIYSGFVAEFVSYGSSMDIIVKTRRVLDYIGEMGILDGDKYANTAVALGDVTLIGIPKEIFLNIMWSNHIIPQYIIKELIKRLTNSAKKTINAMYLSAHGRLAFTIVSLTDDIAHHKEGIRITQNDLAATSGIARQTAAKIISSWREKRWISTSREKLYVLDIDALLKVIMDNEEK